MAKQIEITEVLRPFQLPEGLTNKSQIPAKQCDSYSIACDEIAEVREHVFEDITTATAADKTGALIILKQRPLAKIYVKELASAIRTAINGV